ncbi:MAG: ribosome small subunit-dependent GTPase A [Gemmatimonadota bacterium]
MGKDRPPATDLTAGVVLSVVGGVYVVELEGGQVMDASLRGRLKQERRTGDRVVAGDRVEVAVSGPEAVIESVGERASELARRAPGGRGAKVIVANVDQVVVVFSAARPEPHPGMLDRFLVLAEANRLPVLIVVNKAELVSDDGTSPSERYVDPFAPYPAAGYEVLRTSAKTGLGVAELRERLCGRESVLTGPSGVGKSSLLNLVQPGLGLRIGDVSEAVGKGKHTTVAALLIPLECGGYVADTPGLRELGLWGVEPEELRDCFPEFREHAASCRFGRSCTHTHEPDCGVQDAVTSGAVSPVRYASYQRLLAGDDERR